MNDAFGSPQSVVVLGGTSDIAGAIVGKLAHDRCRSVVLAGRDAVRLETAARAAKAAGAVSVHTVGFDAVETASASATVDRCFELAGEVDLVLMAVGVLGEQRRDEKEASRAAEIATVNYTWPTAALVHAGALLEQQGQGRIMVLSSVAGVRVRRANFLYGSAKAGLDGFAIGLSEALAGSGVTVQILRPGFVRTRMTRGLPPAPFSTTPDAVAQAAVRALASGRCIIWVPPLLRWVFLVVRELPQPLWRRLPG